MYLAGPDVFFPDAVDIGEAKKLICNRIGFKGISPLDADFSELSDLESFAAEGHGSFDLMVQLMDRCDLVIANLTPFRGPSMDVGTVIEIGYMYGHGKPVFGYMNVAADYEEHADPNDCFVEPFGLVDNLMVEGPMYRTGVDVVRADVPPQEIHDSLDGSTRCVDQAAQRLLQERSRGVLSVLSFVENDSIPFSLPMKPCRDSCLRHSAASRSTYPESTRNRPIILVSQSVAKRHLHTLT